MAEHYIQRSRLRLRSDSHLRPFRKLTQPAWWAEQRLKIIGLFWLVALIAGLYGYKLYTPDQSWSNLLYKTLHLPFMPSNLSSGQINGWLDFARFFAPLMALITGLQALALFLGERIQNLKLRHLCRGHVVICGLGRKGTLLAEQFRKSGDRLVLIDRNENNPSAKRFREEGVIVLTGDATDTALLRKAQVGRAKRIVCLCPDDEINAQICMQSWELIGKKRRKPASCLVHVVSPDLCELLRLEMIRKETTDQFRVEFFNIFQMGAWSLISQYPPFDEKAAQADKAPHVVIIGLERFGAEVLLKIAKQWRQLNSNSRNRLRITVVDKEAESKTKALGLAYPKLQTICEVIPWSGEIESAEFQEGSFLLSEQGALEATYIYVCLGDQSIGMRAALSIHHQLRGAKVPIVVCMSAARGLSALLAKKTGPDTRFGSIHPFDLTENTCNIRLVHGVTTEILAQAIHSNYVEGLRAAGVDLRDQPAAVPWEDLSEFLKESNRRQADHIGAKLDAVGCGLAPLRDWDSESFHFTPEEVEKLARMEHQRWWDERVADGWTLGPRDDKRKIHPCMVPWAQLSEEERDKDRQAVVDLPKLLSSIDLQIYRVAAGDGK